MAFGDQGAIVIPNWIRAPYSSIRLFVACMLCAVLSPTVVRAGVPFQKESVLIVGGSAALGWKDKGWMDWRSGWQGGYLVRAFHALSLDTSTTYEVINKAIPGLNGTKLAAMRQNGYGHWLDQFHPDIVVISWGMMNDTRPHTPISTFSDCVHQEIQLALAHNAKVFVVTPPTTTATYTLYRNLEPQYVAAEIQTAEAFHSRRVTVFDLFGSMKRWIAAQGTSYKVYEGDAIHPNALGHRVAGTLLEAQMKQHLNGAHGSAHFE